LTVESLVHCIARTGLSFAGSTGLFAAACLGKLAITTLYYLLDLIGNHNGLLQPLRRYMGEWVNKRSREREARSGEILFFACPEPFVVRQSL
jgi:hypothetical protein